MPPHVYGCIRPSRILRCLSFERENPRRPGNNNKSKRKKQREKGLYRIDRELSNRHKPSSSQNHLVNEAGGSTVTSTSAQVGHEMTLQEPKTKDKAKYSQERRMGYHLTWLETRTNTIDKSPATAPFLITRDFCKSQVRVQNNIYKTEPRYSIVELGIVQGFSPCLLKLITNK